jgi:uncharacterized protein (TIGR01777 family)
MSRTPKPGEFRWGLEAREIDDTALAGADAVVHLAGESIAAGRWNSARKRRILESRVRGTSALCAALARTPRPPPVLITASAIGFYGDRGDELLDEASPAGRGFLADLCREWEAASAPAETLGVRVVKLRIGIVLSRHGGALPRMLLPFRLGLGGVVGSGRQYWSWVTLTDLIGIVMHALETPGLRGPVNAVSPQPATNAEFTRELGKVLHRPTLLPLPAFMARVVLGEMADELLLSSSRVIPHALQSSGYRHRYAELGEGLRHALHT